MFAGKARAYHGHTGLHSKDRLLILPANIGLVTVTNTLAYYNTELITAVKSFIVQVLPKENFLHFLNEDEIF